MIVLGTLFIYAEELSDGDSPQRDQTIVSSDCLPFDTHRVANFGCDHLDLHCLRVPGSHISHTEQGSYLWHHTEQDARSHGRGVVLSSDPSHLFPTSSIYIPDGIAQLS